MKEWTNGEVLGWLTHRFGFWGQQYVPIFSNKKVDGKRLIKLTAEDLKTEFQVIKQLHLIRMIRDIKDASRPIHQINQLIAPLVIVKSNCLQKNKNKSNSKFDYFESLKSLHKTLKINSTNIITHFDVECKDNFKKFKFESSPKFKEISFGFYFKQRFGFYFFMFPFLSENFYRFTHFCLFFCVF